jgi:hypothetical protein
MLANHHAPASHDSPQGDSDQGYSDYHIILAALMGSARGRSFLEEYARRSRVTETATLLTAIGRIENLLTSPSLEPAELPAATDIVAPQDQAASVDAAPVPQVAETLDVDVFEVDAPQNENSAPGAADHDRIVASDVPDIDILSLAVTSVQAPAIEFLGPQSPPAATPDDVPEPDVAPEPNARRAARDPFADIRALSQEEKIALFA